MCLVLLSYFSLLRNNFVYACSGQNTTKQKHPWSQGKMYSLLLTNFILPCCRKRACVYLYMHTCMYIIRNYNRVSTIFLILNVGIEMKNMFWMNHLRHICSGSNIIDICLGYMQQNPDFFIYTIISSDPQWFLILFKIWYCAHNLQN